MNAVAQLPANSLVLRMAAKYGVDGDKMVHTLRETAFKNATPEQLMSLMIVAERYDLNPWLKEIFAFPAQGGGIVPVVGVDGWLRIINSHPQFDGMDFIDGPDEKGGPVWVECRIFRKDRTHATLAREYMAECKRDTQPWKSHPRRMLRHKAIIQCARIAFGFAGIYDPDEGATIVENDRPVIDPRGDVSNIPPAEVEAHFNALVDILNADKDEYAVADMLRDYVAEHLNPAPEVYMLVLDKLKNDSIITKGKFKQWLTLQRPLEGDEKIPT
jgi:phage recombination protein Bet